MDNIQHLQQQLWKQILQHQTQPKAELKSCKHLFQVRKKQLVCAFCKKEKEY